MFIFEIEVFVATKERKNKKGNRDESNFTNIFFW